MPHQPIPRVFHRIWIGGPEPSHHWPWIESWRRLHPDWQIVTWTDQTLPPLRNQAGFDRATSPAQKADIARLELLHRFGGVYLDTDMEAFRSIDALLDGVTFFCGTEDDVWLSTSILGCTAANPVAETLVEELPRSLVRHPDAAINVQSGPPFFTRVVNRLRTTLDPGEITVFPRQLFYPYHFSEPDRANDVFPEAYAAHHWSHSWKAA